MIADSSPRRIARAVLALASLIAGVAHLRSPGGFIAITPDWVPYPATVIWLTGIAEIAGPIGLMLPRAPELVVSWTKAGAATGHHLVGAVGERGDRLAICAAALRRLSLPPAPLG